MESHTQFPSPISDKRRYRHDRRADKRCYRHDRRADSQCQDMAQEIMIVPGFIPFPEQVRVSRRNGSSTISGVVQYGYAVLKTVFFLFCASKAVNLHFLFLFKPRKHIFLFNLFSLFLFRGTTVLCQRSLVYSQGPKVLISTTSEFHVYKKIYNATLGQNILMLLVSFESLTNKENILFIFIYG